MKRKPIAWLVERQVVNDWRPIFHDDGGDGTEPLSEAYAQSLLKQIRQRYPGEQHRIAKYVRAQP